MLTVAPIVPPLAVPTVDVVRTRSMTRPQHSSEPERFNRLTVGREPDKIELKKEVNALLARLGHAPRYAIPPDGPPTKHRDPV